MENQINDAKVTPNNFIRKLLRVIIVIVIILIILGSMIAFLIHRSIQREAKEKIEAKQFLQQVVDSIRNNTDYYKNHSEQRVFKEFNELEPSIKKMSGNYDIIYIDYYLGGAYEYRILFENNTAFITDVVFEKGNPLLLRFLPEHPSQTQKYLEYVRRKAIKDADKPEGKKE
jgi:type II secretory pathway pseudopilin PulG